MRGFYCLCCKSVNQVNVDHAGVKPAMNVRRRFVSIRSDLVRSSVLFRKNSTSETYTTKPRDKSGFLAPTAHCGGTLHEITFSAYAKMRSFPEHLIAPSRSTHESSRRFPLAICFARALTVFRRITTGQALRHRRQLRQQFRSLDCARASRFVATNEAFPTSAPITMKIFISARATRPHGSSLADGSVPPQCARRTGGDSRQRRA